MGRCFSRLLHNEDDTGSEAEYGRDRAGSLNFVHQSSGDSQLQQPQRYIEHRLMAGTDMNFANRNPKSSSLARHGSLGMDNEKMYRVESSPSTFFGDNNSPVIFRQQHTSAAHSAPDHRMANNGGVIRGGNNGMSKVIAIYDYDSRVEGDISFRKGDVMLLMDTSNNDWWYVKHPQYGSGYAPRNFLGRLDSLESEESICALIKSNSRWYAGRIQRSLAEKLVFAGNLPRGSFLVRRRDATDEYALTINDSRDGVTFDVKHYKIRPLDGGAGFFITTRKVFSSISQLIAYYRVESGGLCYRLTAAAPRMAPIRTDLSHDTQKNYEIPREEIQLIRKLGDGNFGEVWFGKWRGIVEVAVKTMKQGTMSVEAFLAEAHIMKQCNHPKLVKLYAVCTTMVPYYIITEFMINGSLLHFLRREGDTLGPHALVDMCAQVANGMMYLESRKLVHRDLAARNVLVGEKISGVPEVKVADFGLARKLVNENTYEAQTGAKFPIKWTAPEAATLGNFTVKSDIWSYGILIYEVFTFGHTPYPGMQNREVIEQLEQGYRMPRPQTCPEPVYAEMLKCWDGKPEKRPTFEHLFAFFDDYFVSSQPNYVPPSVDGVGAIISEVSNG